MNEIGKPMKVDVKIGKRLKMLRRQKKLTQKDVAQALNISTMSYSRYEQDLRQPDFETLAILGLLFNVSIGQIFSDSIFYGSEYIEKYEFKLNEDFIDNYDYFNDLESAISQRSRDERRAVRLIYRIRTILKTDSIDSDELSYLSNQLKLMLKDIQWIEELIQGLGSYKKIDDEIINVLSNIQKYISD